MLYSLKNLVKIVLGTQPPGRLCPVRKDDTFIVSYPKSGNTWVRFLVGNLLYPGSVSFTNIETLIPDLYMQSLYYFLNMKSPRLIKSHESFDRRYNKAIYIVRDPRDVVVSYWYHHKKFQWIDENTTIKDFTNDFVYRKIDTFGSWKKNVSGWLEAKEKNKVNILFLKYEDLLISPEEEINKIINYLDIRNITQEIIEQALANSSFESMKEMENNQSKEWRLSQKSRQDIQFVRKGQAGGWKSELPQQSADLITNAWGPLMSRLGYI